MNNVSLSYCSLPAEIPLTQGLVALVDDADYEFLMQWNWYALKAGKFYAARGEKGRNIRMHHVLIDCPEGYEVDHINSNSLDNRRSNLRICTHKQNRWNSKPQRGSSSRYKGVSYQKATDYYKAYIIVNGVYKHLGCYLNEDDAARAYNKAAIVEHGEFAKLNPISGEPGQRLIHPVQGKFHQSKAVCYDRL